MRPGHGRGSTVSVSGIPRACRSVITTRRPTRSEGGRLPRERRAEMSGGAGEPPVRRVDIPSGQGVQVGEGGTQDNTFIQTYIGQQVIQPPSGPVSGPVVAGEVPLPPAAFQPREGLLAALRDSGPGVSVVRSV